MERRGLLPAPRLRVCTGVGVVATTGLSAAIKDWRYEDRELSIVLGTRMDLGNGELRDCAERRYKKKSVRQNFSLFFVPVVPLAELGQYIECQTCGGTFREEVLDYRPGPTTEEIEAEFKRAIRQVMILMMTSDSQIAAEEITAIRDIYRQLAGAELSEADVRRETPNVRHRKGQLLGYLKEVSGYLNDIGKEMVVKAAFLVAAADQNLHHRENEFLADVGKALGMSPAHMKAVVQEMISS
jgi:tellurite resistance protein